METNVTLQLMNPPRGCPLPTYAHVIIASGTQMAFIADQEPGDASGNWSAGGDLAAPARQVLASLSRALAAAGASPGRLLRSRSMSFIICPSSCD